MIEINLKLEDINVVALVAREIDLVVQGAYAAGLDTLGCNCAGAVGARLFGLLGINIGYHRLLTHRGFKCPKWLEHALVVIAVCCAEDTPARPEQTPR